MQTYLTLAEADLFFPTASDFDTDSETRLESNNALTISKGLVDTYINPEVTVPVVPVWDGQDTIEAPAVLKACQAAFFRWQLLTGNSGWSQDLQNLYDATVKILQRLDDKSLLIPHVQVPEHQAGYHITKATVAASGGMMFLKEMPAPSVRTHYRIVVTSEDSKYVGDEAVTFSVFRSDNDDARVTDKTATFEWQVVDSAFSIRWDGSLTNGDEFEIIGIPTSEINTSTPSNTLKQAPLNYGSR